MTLNGVDGVGMRLTGVRSGEQDLVERGAKGGRSPFRDEGASLRFCPGQYYIVTFPWSSGCRADRLSDRKRNPRSSRVRPDRFRDPKKSGKFPSKYLARVGPVVGPEIGPGISGRTLFCVNTFIKIELWAMTWAHMAHLQIAIAGFA